MQALWETFRNGLMSVLPLSPFRSVISGLAVASGSGLGWLNWFIPVGAFLKVFSLWLAAYTVYLLYQIVMRWVGLIA